MANEVANLGIVIDSTGIIKADKSLERLAKTSASTENKTLRLVKATDTLTMSQRASVTATGKMSTELKALGASMGAFVGIATAFAGINVFAKFEQAIADLSAITGATGKDLQFYSDAAREMGATTTLSASQAADAFRLVASAKPDLLKSAEALKSVTQQAVILAEAAGITMPEAADTMANALNQFGAEADQANRFINVLAAGANFGAASIAEIGESLKMSGVVASQFGLSFEDANAALQLLSTNAIKGSEAGTGLRGVLLSLETKMSDEFKPSVVGMVQAFDNLGKANLTASEQLKIFGRENITAAAVLSANSERLQQLTSDITGTSMATEQAATRTDTLIGTFKNLMSAVEDVAIGVGTKLEPAINGVMKATTLLIQNFDVVAMLIAARLVPAVITATTAIVAQGYALVTTKIAMVAFGQSAGLAAGAMALLGGPMGILALTAGALYLYINSGETAVEKTARLTSEVGNLTGAYESMSASALAAQRAIVTGQYSAVSEELIAAREQMASYGVSTGAVAADVEKTAIQIDLLEQELVRLGVSEEAIVALQAKMMATNIDTAFDAGAEAIEKQSKAMVELAEKYKILNETLGMSEKQQALYNASVVEGVDFKTKAGKTIEQSIIKYHDEKDALDAATKATEDHKNAITDSVTKYGDLLSTVEMTAREQAIYNDVVRQGIELSSAEGKAITETINLYHDKVDAIEIEKKAHEETAEAAKSAAETQQRAYEKALDFTTDLFEETIDNWESGWKGFADSVVDIIKKMLKRIAAEYAASKVLQFLGVGSAAAGASSLSFGSISGVSAGGSGSAGTIANIANYGQSIYSKGGAIMNGASAAYNAGVAGYQAGGFSGAASGAYNSIGASTGWWSGAAGGAASSSSMMSTIGGLSESIAGAAPWAFALSGALEGYNQSGAKGAIAGGVGGYYGATGGMALGSQIGTAILPGIGTVVGAALGALVGGFAGSKLGASIFGGQYKTKDYGLNLGVSGGELDANRWEYQKKKGGAFSSTKRRTVTSDLDAATAAAFGDAISTTQTAIVDSANILGLTVSESVFDNFSSASMKISTKGKTDEEIAKALEDYFTNVSQQMVNHIVELKGMTVERLGELATALSTVNVGLEAIGAKLISSSINGAKASEKLIEMAGGFDAFATSMTNFNSLFVEQRTDFEIATDFLTGVMGGFGKDMPATREAFTAMVLGLNLMTDSGRTAFATLTGLSVQFDAYYTELERLEIERQDAAIAAAEIAAATTARLAEEAATAAKKAADDLIDLSFRQLGSAFGTERDRLNGLRVTDVAANDFASFADFRRASSAVELTNDGIDKQISALDAIEQYSRDQIDIQRGTYEATLSVGDAINNLSSALGVDISSGAAFNNAIVSQSAPTPSPSSGGQVVTQNGTVADASSAVPELVKLNALIDSFGYELVLNSLQIKKILDRWDGDGLPDERSVA